MFFIYFFLGHDENIQICIHLTSIYDYSLFEAMSRVVQNMVPHMTTLEDFLNIIVHVKHIFNFLHISGLVLVFS